MNKIKARKRRGAKTKALIRLSGKRRLVISRSASNIYAQLIETAPGGDKVLAQASTLDKELQTKFSKKSKVEQAMLVGKKIAEQAKTVGVTEVAFDRSGYKYHGRVKALADGAREAGLNF